jgi:endogenous inhibitor of DNA gyrase (YacG/DUF329 family)
VTAICPGCGSKHLRSSSPRTVLEKFAELLGVLHFRCRHCDVRFRSVIWDLRNLLYARCPRCYGVDLTGWKLENYRVPSLWKFWLALGAQPRRCEPCRCIFLSFRPRKRLSRHRNEPLSTFADHELAADKS